MPTALRGHVDLLLKNMATPSSGHGTQLRRVAPASIERCLRLSLPQSLESSAGYADE
jgi:hypothetical protein